MPGLCQDERAVLLDLPDTGRFEGLAERLAGALAETGLLPTDLDASDDIGDPAVTVLYSGKRYDAEWLEFLKRFLAAGGGVVYLYGSTSRHMEPASEFLGIAGLGIAARSTQRVPAQLFDHPVTAGVKGLPDSSYNAHITGAARQIVAAQANAVVAAAATVGSGRVVVLPANMVTSADRDGLSAAQARLLANACLWAAELDTDTAAPAELPAGAPTVEAPPAGPDRTATTDSRPRPMRAALNRPRHSPDEDFSGAALVDVLAGDDNWQTLADVLDDALGRVGLQPRYLDAVSHTSPLVDALASRPALAVIGSTRQFTTDESVAVAHYAAMGGRVLIIGHASPAFVIRLVDVNSLASEFGISMSMIRFQAATNLTDHAITSNLPVLPAMPWGVAVWSNLAAPIARAGTHSYLSVLHHGGARVAAIDGKVLLVGTAALRSPVRTGPKQPFLPLVDATLQWLTEDANE